MVNPPSAEGSRAIPSGRRVEGRVRPPSSKSFMHRYLNLAWLSGAKVEVERPLLAEDTELFLAALGQAGWRVEREAWGLRLVPGAAPPECHLFCGNAGTFFRFAVASAAALGGSFVIDGTPRLRQRPVAPLLAALAELGPRIEFLGEPGHAPLRIAGDGLRGGFARLDAGESSQYLSALLMAGLAAREPLEIELSALTSEPYVELTLAAMRRFGGVVEPTAPSRFRVEPGINAPERVTVEGDYSAACYPAAAAALTGGVVEILGMDPMSPQGDRRFLELLASMGADVRVTVDGWRVEGTDRLDAVEVDLSSMPDQVPTLAALAPFARGTTRIRNVAHLRIKESDRLAAMSRELSRLGARVDEHPDGLSIEGVWHAHRPPSEDVEVDSHGDHRIAMSCALVGFRRPGVRVGDPACVGKSYPDFWRDLETLLGP